MISDNLIKFMKNLGFEYNYSTDDDHHVLNKGSVEIIFDDRYDYIEVLNNIGSYTIDYDDIFKEN